jgi:hypothetical protein
LFFDAVWKIPEARQQASKENSFDVVWKILESNQQQRRTVLKWCGRSRKRGSKQERRTAVAAMARARLAVHGASGSYCPLGFCVFLFCSALLLQAGFADVNQDLLNQINKYRIAENLPALTENQGAACVAQGLANYYKGKACTNSTGADVLDGSEPENLPAVLPTCNLQPDNVENGFIAPDCVPTGTSPADASLVAFQNYTEFYGYSEQLNMTQFTSAGVGSVDNEWFVLVLATNESGGNFVSQNLDPNASASPSHQGIALTLTATLVAALAMCLFL